MIKNSKGVIYITTGKYYAQEAEFSASSLKKVVPGINITIFTTDEVDEKLFDQIIWIENGRKDNNVIKSDKIKYITESPYERTVFLDSDTLIAENFSEIYSLLDKFDLAAAHAPARINEKKPRGKIPLSFPEINTGVILYKKNPRTKKLFRKWSEEFMIESNEKDKKSDDPLDQPSFRRALYESDVRFTVLTPEFNCRFISPGYVWGKVYIFHGRHNDLNYISKRLNSNSGRRIYYLKSRRKLFFRLKQLVMNFFNELSIWFY